jgi:hypothetical protein
MTAYPEINYSSNNCDCVNSYTDFGYKDRIIMALYIMQ